MKLKFFPATLDQSDSEQIIKDVVSLGYSEQKAREAIAWASSKETFLSECGTYQVQIDRTPRHGFDMALIHLSIKRVDREAIHDWRVLQAIKNALVGEECEAIELYPAESRLIDTANQYHLWAFTDPEVRLPFGWQERSVVDKPIGKSKQRAFG